MYFLGIDAGGSQTRALVCDAGGNIVGRGLSGPCNPCTQSREACLEQLQSATRDALADNARESIIAAHLGVAGAGDPYGREIIESISNQLFNLNTTRVDISHDLKIAHAGGLAGRPGSALVAGTGSACFGIDSKGTETITGGWGDLIDDAGSGSWVGLRALQLCVRQADGRASGNALQRGVLRFLGLDSVDQIKARIHFAGLPRNERAKLAPVVFELARSGDATAGGIVAEAVSELTLIVQCNLNAVGLGLSDVVLLGGLSASAYFRERLAASIQSTVPGVTVLPPRLNATAGAILLAMRRAGIRFEETVIERLQRRLT